MDNTDLLNYCVAERMENYNVPGEHNYETIRDLTKVGDPLIAEFAEEIHKGMTNILNYWDDGDVESWEALTGLVFRFERKFKTSRRWVSSDTDPVGIRYIYDQEPADVIEENWYLLEQSVIPAVDLSEVPDTNLTGLPGQPTTVDPRMKYRLLISSNIDDEDHERIEKKAALAAYELGHDVFLLYNDWTGSLVHYDVSNVLSG